MIPTMLGRSSLERVRAELVRLILLEMEFLPSHLRTAFKLVHIVELPAREAAKKLGISVNTVWAQQGTAIRKIKASLAKKRSQIHCCLWKPDIVPL